MAPRWLVILSLAFTSASVAAPPPDMPPNPLMEAWFKALHQPSTHKPCCSISDCRFTDYRERDGSFEVTIDDWPYTVPDAVVLHDVTSPTAQAVVCYAYTGFDSPVPAGEVRATPQDTVTILCFIPVGRPS